MSTLPEALRQAPGLNVGYQRSTLVSVNSLTVEDIRSEFLMAFKEVCALSGTDGSFLFSSSKEPWNTWFGVLFTTRCFMRAVEDSRAVLWATFKGSSDARLRKLVRDVADVRRWCAVDNECRGLDAALTDGYSGGICAAEYEADSVVVKEKDGITVVKNLNDLEKMMQLPFRFRIFHVRANDKLNQKEDAYKHDLAKEKVSEVIYANRANILQDDQVFASIATTSESRTFHHSIGYWRWAESQQWPEDDTLWADFDTPV